MTSTNDTKPTLIIGIGNRLRQDDGFGPAVADRLRERHPDRRDLSIQTVHQLLPEMVEWVKHAPTVIFIDAAVQAEHRPPGSIAWHRLNPQLDAKQTGHPQPLSHFLTPETLLRLAQTLYSSGQAPKQAWILTACGTNFGVGEGLSAAVRGAVPEAIYMVEAAVANLSIRRRLMTKPPLNHGKCHY